MKTFLFLIMSLNAYAFKPVSNVRYVTLNEKFSLALDEVVWLKGTKFTLSYKGMKEHTPCAMPGQNCGAGYTPPQPQYKFSGCKPLQICQYAIIAGDGNNKSANFEIKTAESCDVNKQILAKDQCLYEMTAMYLLDEKVCEKIQTALIKADCLKVFKPSKK